MLLGAAAIVMGTIAALCAKNFPLYKSRLEQCGGALLLSGVALVAFAFPFM